MSLPDDTPYDALISLAEFHQKLAEDLRAKAEAKAKSEQRRQAIAARRAKLTSAARFAADLIHQGQDRIPALKEASERHEMQAEAIALILPNILKKDKAQDLVKIMRLAHRGWTNQAIAQKFGIHEKTVSRLIRKAWTG